MGPKPEGTAAGPSDPGATPAPGPGSDPGAAPAGSRRWPRRVRRVGWVLLSVLAVWVLAAYVVLPALWRHYEHQPGLVDAPKTTVTGSGIPGDPLNVGLVGSRAAVVRALTASGWDPADPVTLRTSLEIAGSVLRDKPYPDAPVSPLFVFGRQQDLAFERPAGASPKQRHHVRFWEVPGLGRTGAPLWIGAITFDRSVGLSHTTGQITHHIGPDVDRERDDLMAGLSEHGWLVQLYQVTGVGATLLGRNGGGDPYYTDGELTIGVIAPEAERGAAPERLSNPPAVALKQQFWTAIRPLLRSLPTGD